MGQEIWKKVKNYEDFYEVSSFGKIRTIERYIMFSTYKYLKKQKYLIQYEDGRGYLHVKLYDGKGKPKSLTIHRIVLSTFNPTNDNTLEVNHLDGNKLNNNLINLDWCTRSENIKHAYNFRDPKTYKGSGNKNSKLKEEEVIALREEYKQPKTTYKDLAIKYNVGTTLIGYIINNKTWKHV